MSVYVPIGESLERCPRCRTSLVPFDGCEDVSEGMACERCGRVYRESGFESRGGKQVAVWKQIANLIEADGP